MNIYIQQNYCVYITHYHGSLFPNNYIGSSSINKIEEGYRGSVKSKKYKKLWEQELRVNPHLFETLIISTHYTKQEALYKELILQKMFNVVKSDLFVNLSYAAPNGFFGMDVSGKNNPNYENKWNEDKRKHLSDIRKSNKMKEQIIKTNLMKRGVEHHTKTEENEIKKKTTNLKKYGVDNVSQCPEIKIKKVKKIKETREVLKLNKFGYDDKEKFIKDILLTAKTKNLYDKNGKLIIGSLLKYFNKYGKGEYSALLRFCANNNILYIK